MKNISRPLLLAMRRVTHGLLCLLLFTQFAVAQSTGFPATITGKVNDAKNAPMEGVSVMIKGTKRGVTTNSAGSFTITNVPANARLVFSYTGYADQEVSVKNTSPPQHFTG